MRVNGQPGFPEWQFSYQKYLVSIVYDPHSEDYQWWLSSGDIAYASELEDTLEDAKLASISALKMWCHLGDVPYESETESVASFARLLEGEERPIYFFIDFKLTNPKPEVKQDYLLNSLCSFQYHHGTEEEHTFTVLEPPTGRVSGGLRDGLAFTQRYKKVPPNQCTHSHMWKHEPGVENPDSPSYDELMKQVNARVNTVQSLKRSS